MSFLAYVFRISCNFPVGTTPNTSLNVTFRLNIAMHHGETQYLPEEGKKNIISCSEIMKTSPTVYCLTVLKNYPVYHVEVLFRAAEVVGKVRYAERLMLARVHPSLILRSSRDPVKKDPEGLPHGLLTN